MRMGICLNSERARELRLGICMPLVLQTWMLAWFTLDMAIPKLCR